MDELEALRRRIRNLDAAMLALAAERMELARDVGQAKHAAGVPLRDFEVEKRVLERAAGTAAELGMAPELARALMRALIDESCRVQEVARSEAYSGAAETILVVGGRGQMGRWFARFFASQGHRVRVCDRVADDGEFPDAPTLESGLEGATLALVAVPLEGVAESLDAIAAAAPLAGFRGTVCDIASLKGHLAPAVGRARAAGLAVTSIHPMFGPSARTLADRVICLCDCGVPAATEHVASLFRDTAAALVPLSFESHDRIAAYVLGLSHVLNLAFARALAASGLSLAELSAVGSSTFQAQLATTASVAGDNPDLYYAIQKLNAATPRVHADLARAFEDLRTAVARGDREGFTGAMGAARRWLETGAPVA
jgi:chorismate mutase/prephenate dehydrogenase